MALVGAAFAFAVAFEVCTAQKPQNLINVAPALGFGVCPEGWALVLVLARAGSVANGGGRGRGGHACSAVAARLLRFRASVAGVFRPVEAGYFLVNFFYLLQPLKSI